MAFDSLKEKLSQAPILSYPQFGPSAAPFHLYTDASAMGVGAVLEQEGHVIAYASLSLTPSERNYSAIQRECLAVVYGTKQFAATTWDNPSHSLWAMHPCSGFLPRRWKVFWHNGLWPFKNTTSPLFTGKAHRMAMLMLCQGDPLLL